MLSDRPSLLLPPNSSKSPAMKPEGAAASHPAQCQRRRPSRQNSGDPSELRLPGLPRFHPANFPSSHSSLSATPGSGINSPQQPMSPRSQQRQFSEAQRQLYAYQLELLAAAGKGFLTPAAKPTSPRLAPCGSPGPVTPLELEGDGYLVAGSSSPNKRNPEYVEKLIQNEVARSKGDLSPRRTQMSVGSR
jgi:hypothetical protein